MSVKQQPYRHVDTLSVMNIPEIHNFVSYWSNTLLENALQRMGWMYGYYIEDTNYDEGCRAVLEGVRLSKRSTSGTKLRASVSLT